MSFSAGEKNVMALDVFIIEDIKCSTVVLVSPIDDNSDVVVLHGSLHVIYVIRCIHLH